MFKATACTFLVLSFAALGQGSTYYVSTAGNDKNSGSKTLPWRTIQHACNSVAAGDTVYVESGKYSETVVIRTSMNLLNVTGQRPLIDATGLAVLENDAAVVLIKNVNKVTLSGFEIANYKTTNSNLVPCGVFVEGKDDQVTVSNNLIHNIENDGSNANSINAFGIAVYGNSAVGAITNLVISANEVRNTKTGSSETVTINGNVNGFRVTNNYVHDVNNIGIDCIGFEGTSPISGQDQARNGYVGENVVERVTSKTNPAYFGGLGADGLYVDGGANIVIERNTVRAADIGIEVASEHGGHYATGVTVRSNLVLFSNLVGLSIGGYASNKGGTKSCTFVNNTFFRDDTTNSGSGEFQIQFNTSGDLVANNVFSASGQGVLISSQTGTGSNIGVNEDYNLFYAVANPSWSWDGKSYSSLASFKAGSGEDEHSLEGIPDFVSTSTPDLHLTSASIALAAGKNFGASVVGTLDLDGNPRVVSAKIDLGCYERPSSAP